MLDEEPEVNTTVTNTDSTLELEEEYQEIREEQELDSKVCFCSHTLTFHIHCSTIPIIAVPGTCFYTTCLSLSVSITHTNQILPN